MTKSSVKLKFWALVQDIYYEYYEWKESYISKNEVVRTNQISHHFLNNNKSLTKFKYVNIKFLII